MPQHRLPVGSWGKVTVSRRGGAWQARVYVRDGDGVRRQVRAQAPTKAAARRALAARLAVVEERIESLRAIRRLLRDRLAATEPRRH